eukprot:SAG11_NODE_7052_length_1202_cov_2.026292_1_plen_175_part_00
MRTSRSAAQLMSARAWMAPPDLDVPLLHDPAVDPPRSPAVVAAAAPGCGDAAALRPAPPACGDRASAVWVVGLWCAFGWLANYQWNFYSPIAVPVKAVYGMSDGMVAWLSNANNLTQARRTERPSFPRRPARRARLVSCVCCWRRGGGVGGVNRARVRHAPARRRRLQRCRSPS